MLPGHVRQLLQDQIGQAGPSGLLVSMAYSQADPSQGAVWHMSSVMAPPLINATGIFLFLDDRHSPRHSAVNKRDTPASWSLCSGGIRVSQEISKPGCVVAGVVYDGKT